MKINNVELEDLDFMDADTLEKVETALEEYRGSIKEVEDFEKLSEYMRYNCKLSFKLFNDIFGEGTDEKVFGNKTNLLLCVKAVDELVTSVNSIKSKQEKEIERLTQKYTSRQRK